MTQTNKPEGGGATLNLTAETVAQIDTWRDRQATKPDRQAAAAMLIAIAVTDRRQKPRSQA